MGDDIIYLNEDNKLFMQGLCEYYRKRNNTCIPNSLITLGNDLEHLPIYIFENGFMEEEFVEKWRLCYENCESSGYICSSYKDLLRFINNSMNIEHGYYYIIIYTIFNAYVYNRKNFDNFSAIVNDIAHISVTNFHVLKLLDKIVRIENYKNMPNVRSLLRTVLKCNSMSLSQRELIRELENEFIEVYDQMNRDYKLLNSKCSLDNYYKILDVRVGHLLEKYYSGFSYILNTKEEQSLVHNCYFYDRILLIGDRYNYFNEKLKQVEDNIGLRRHICFFLRHFNVDLFEELNEECDNKKDFFITCIDILFDSDSYQELVNKAEAIIKASNSYESGQKQEAFSIIKDLNSDKYKDTYCGQKVAYPRNTMNMVVKPKRIVDRMKDLYSKIDSSISYDFIDEYHDKHAVIDSLLLSIDSYIENEKRPSTRFKKKMKSLFDRKKG